MSDIVGEITGVARKVSGPVLAAGEARTVTLSRSYDAPIEDVWDACTSAVRIPRWFLPVSGELRVGGRYQLEGNAGGTIERCDPPNGFAATWEFDGNVTWIELRLQSELPSRTLFELDHTAKIDDRWTDFGPGAVGIGWDLTIRGLGQHIDSGQALDAAAYMAWTMSPDGVEFMTQSSRAWCAADIESGTDRAKAQARAERATAAYLGPPAS